MYKHFSIDNRGEYTFNEFEYYIFQHGIKHQTTVACNPQQIGVAGRMNTTFLKMVHSMMFFKNVKLMFWGDAILCEMEFHHVLLIIRSLMKCGMVIFLQ